MIRIEKFLLYSAFFGDSLVEKVFRNRDKLMDQVLCIIIQAVFVCVVCIPLAIGTIFMFLFLFPNTDDLKVFIYIYLFLSLTFMVPIILNLENTEYSFPKSLINIYFVFKTVSIKPLRTFLNFVLICFIVYFLFILSNKILSYYPQIQSNYLFFGYIVFIQVLMMIFLESTSDELKRALRQFSFWLLIFTVFLFFSFTQLGLYILPKLDNESALNAIIILIGITFNLAQVLSSGREVYKLALEKVDREGLIEKAYEEAFTYMNLLNIVEEYKNTQKELFHEIKKEIKRIGFGRFIIKITPFILIGLGSLMLVTIIQIYSDNIGHLFQRVIDFVVKMWVLLLGGDKNFALYVFLLLLSFYYFFYNLKELIRNFKNQNIILILTRIEMILFALNLIMAFISMIFGNFHLLGITALTLGTITILLGVIISFAQNITTRINKRKNSNKNNN